MSEKPTPDEIARVAHYCGVLGNDLLDLRCGKALLVHGGAAEALAEEKRQNAMCRHEHEVFVAYANDMLRQAAERPCWFCQRKPKDAPEVTL